MKNITIIALVALTGVVFSLGITAQAGSVGKNVKQASELWTRVYGNAETDIYRVADSENGVMCYVGYTGKNAATIDCVKVK